MKIKQIFLLLFGWVLMYSNISNAEQSQPWEKSKATIIRYMSGSYAEEPWPWAQNDIISAAPFVDHVLETCSDEDIRVLYGIGLLADMLKVYEALSVETAIITYNARINATKCEIKKLEKDSPLSARYSEPALKGWYWFITDAHPEYLESFKKLDQEYFDLRELRCDLSIQKDKYIWRNCYDLKPFDEILSIPSTQAEINNLPPMQPEFYNRTGQDFNTLYRYRVAEYISVDARSRASNYSPKRYAAEIYNTYPANMKLCPPPEVDDNCIGKAYRYGFIEYMKGRMNAPDFDISKLNAGELLYVRMIEAGMFDKPDQPPSVEFAKYPPPLVPNWSEYFEKDRYTAETGNVPPEPVAEPYAKVVKEQPMAESKPEPVKESKEVVAESGVDQDKQLLIGIVAGAAVLLLLGFYALRRRKK